MPTLDPAPVGQFLLGARKCGRKPVKPSGCGAWPESNHDPCLPFLGARNPSGNLVEASLSSCSALRVKVKQVAPISPIPTFLMASVLPLTPPRLLPVTTS